MELNFIIIIIIIETVQGTQNKRKKCLNISWEDEIRRNFSCEFFSIKFKLVGLLGWGYFRLRNIIAFSFFTFLFVSFFFVLMLLSVCYENIQEWQKRAISMTERKWRFFARFLIFVHRNNSDKNWGRFFKDKSFPLLGNENKSN